MIVVPIEHPEEDIQDIVRSILGVKSQNADIVLHKGNIIFRTDKTMLYVVNYQIDYPIDIPVNTDNLSVNDMINSYYNCTKPMNLVLKYEDLQEDPRFVELTELKSKDGMRFYDLFDNNHNVYKIPMYVGFVKFNKGDKADIEVYDYPDGPYWLNKFIVRKKKLNYPIQVYFLTLKL